MGDVVPLLAPRPRRQRAGALAMGAFLGVWFVAFLAMFALLASHRLATPRWPPAELPAPGTSLGLLGLALMLLGSGALELGLARLREGRPEVLAPALLVTLVLGGAFATLEWPLGRELWAQRGTDEPWATAVLGLFALHAAQLTAGLGALAWLTVRAFQRAYAPARHLPVRLWATFWHSMGAAWACAFASVFLV
jgi:heme/copper-type cytochrome/quinol oxidase subunit 3